MVGRLKSREAPSLELLGTTLKALRLEQKAAEDTRHELLERLGLQPLSLGVALRAGDQVSLLPSAEEMMASATPIEGIVAKSAGEYEPTVLVSIEGMPPAPVERAELAVWDFAF